uniref:Uncharacterized protein n=1 Tax=Oryza sativa subsp. japonica TaxID=39947 RepID=Q6ZI03_ORYSJ|nr:hypothetical protein [Oryza sativa Japonica Group]
MATLDGLVQGRGDPFFSLTIFFSNPPMWMDLERTGGRDPTLIAGRRQGVGVVADGYGDACGRRVLLGGGILGAVSFLEASLEDPFLRGVVCVFYFFSSKIDQT